MSHIINANILFQTYCFKNIKTLVLKWLIIKTDDKKNSSVFKTILLIFQ